jgi:tRNA threonylcarbamoyladenosine biosynthesis protein TsaE
MELSLPKDTKNLSKKISKLIKNGDIIFLYGEIGVGKTTFVRFLINHLEVENKNKKSDILSPTFNIVYDYEIGKIKISHYDLYRIKNYKDILELGMFENSKDSITIIEWPELIKPKPIDRIDILLKYSKSTNSRKVKLTGHGKWKDYQFNEI